MAVRHANHYTKQAVINNKCNLKCTFIIKFEIKMADILDVIVSKAAVHGLRYANCAPFLVIVK